jgi:hypothetical protein
MDYAQESLKKHAEWQGKLDIVPSMICLWPIRRELPSLALKSSGILKKL